MDAAIADLLDTLARLVADGALDDSPHLRRATIDALRAAGVDLARYAWATDPDTDTEAR